MCTSQEKLIGENRSFGNILQLKFSLPCPGTAFSRYWSLCFPTSAFSALYHLPPFHVVLIFLLLPYSLNLVCPTVIKMSHQDSDATWDLSLYCHKSTQESETTQFHPAGPLFQLLGHCPSFKPFQSPVPSPLFF